MPLHDYTPGELQPRKLNPSEIEDPHQVIFEFFNYAHLPQVREQMWEMLKVTVTGSYNKELSNKERSGLLFFFDKLEKLVEAAHLMHVAKSAKE